MGRKVEDGVGIPGKKFVERCLVGRNSATMDFMTRPVEAQRLEQLLRDHSAALELYATGWTTAPEDCVQEAFVELARQRAVPENAVAWLYRVVRNRAMNMARGDRRRRQHERLAARGTKTWFESSAGEALDAREVTKALRSLPDEQREVVVARLWGGLTFDEIAEVTGTSTSSAHRRYQAGITALRNKLGVTWLTK